MSLNSQAFDAPSFFSPRIGQAELAALCRRLSIALTSGVDVRKVLKRESSGRPSPRLRGRLAQISAAIDRGDSMSDALEATGEYFPLLLRELVDVGEHTGHLAEVFQHLAEHYEHQVRLRRMFLAGIAWPVLQLVGALAVIGVLILVMGLVAGTGKPVDILGLGLTGPSGLVIYCLILSAIAGGLVFVYQAARRGLVWTKPLQRAVLALPGIGSTVQTICLAQFAWSLQLTLEAGMDVLRALPLSLRSTRNARYTDHTEQVVTSLRNGHEIAEALYETRVFPGDFLDAVEVGERSGRLPESLASLSKNYQDQAKRAMAALAVSATVLVWAGVALMIIFAIFRMAMNYVNMINGFVNDPMNYNP